MKKISLLILVISVFVYLSCERDDICPEITPTTPSLIIDVFEKNILRVQQDYSRDMLSKDNNYEQYLTKYVNGLIDDFNFANYNTLIKDDYYYSILNQINGWRTGHLQRLKEFDIPEMRRTLGLIKEELEK